MTLDCCKIWETALREVGQLDESLVEYQAALDLDPKSVPSHLGQGQTLLGQGRYAEAEVSTRRALELTPAGHPFRATATQQLERCRELQGLDAKLTAVLEGKAKPATP